ncbi:MAG: phosphatidylglycerophosphatase A [Candidatus Omnitrophica bacterium]|nr:phosphatidylglycerophosphatase A [Candidatus Omnitrophota bacterium]
MTAFLVRVVSTVGFVGYLPLIPGTFGSFAALGVYCFIADSPFLYTAVTIAVIAAGFAVSGRMERVSGRKDPGCVVIDEVAGMLLALWGVCPDIRYVVLGFVFFRILDTFKPYPAGVLQRLKGSTGIMADDLIAGVYANLVLQVIIRLAS